MATFPEIESDRRNDRPELAAALNAYRKHKTAWRIAKLVRLARNAYFINQGAFQTGDYEEIMNKATCLSLLSNAVLVWNTVHMARSVAQLQAAGETITDADLARPTPLEREEDSDGFFRLRSTRTYPL